jgi:serine/threonine-protein kinase
VLRGGAPRIGTKVVSIIPAGESKTARPIDATGRGKSGRKFVIVLVAAILAASLAVMVYVWRGRIPAQPGMLYVPEGTFLAGPNKVSTQLNAFFIDQTEVSNADFAEFCRVTGCSAPGGAPDLPIVNITVPQARAFAQWKGKRLPSQLEWERMARGVDGVRYPWGDAEDPSRANLRDNPTLAAHALMPVKSFKAEPAFQMAGNAWEMVDGNIAPSEAAVALFAKLLSPPPTAGEKWIQIRGGSFNTPIAAAVAYEWSPIPERYSSSDIGFRCAKTP